MTRGERGDVWHGHRPVEIAQRTGANVDHLCQGYGRRERSLYDFSVVILLRCAALLREGATT